MAQVRSSAATPEFKAWFEEELEKIVKPTAGAIIRDSEHMPMIRVYMKDGSISMYLMPKFDSTVVKDIAATLHNLAGASENVDAAMFLCEAWAVVTPRDTKRLDSIAEHPDRREILMVNCIKREMRMIATIEINGSLEKGDRTFGEMTIADANEPGTMATGRFADGPPGKLDS